MIKWLLSFIVVALVISASIIYGYYQQLNQPLDIDSSFIINIKQGSSATKVLSQFSVANKPINTTALSVLLRLKPELASIKSGHFQIYQGLTAVSLLQLLVDGKEHQFSVTFVEGSTFKQWLAVLAKLPYIKHSAMDISDISEKLAIKQQNPEGWFFPDTYMYTAGDTSFSILKRAHQRMVQHLDEVWQLADPSLPYKNSYEVLIMASIIEKETSILAEQPKISSVFINRLNKGMRLQTDPTIIYGLGERYTGDITYANIREKTAYNTYRIDGLPPTPIALPGRESIHAALHPEDGDALYFVARGDGSHKFSRTLAEHQKAVREFQLNRREDYRSFPAPGSETSSNGEQ